jgi:hypothetical protein
VRLMQKRGCVATVMRAVLVTCVCCEEELLGLRGGGGGASGWRATTFLARFVLRSATDGNLAMSIYVFLP